MQITFEKFRCFGDPQSGTVAPITLLVGENSAGKSTFLAGLRYMLDFIGRGVSPPSFNKDPFFLGGYRSIAHFRGGKYGRAETFKIGIIEKHEESKSVQPELFDRDSFDHSANLKFDITFHDVEGDAKPIEYEIRFGGLSVKIYLSNDNEVKAVARDERDGFARELRARSSSSVFTSRSDILTLEYLLRDIALGRTASEVTTEEARVVEIVERVWNVFRRLALGPRRRPQVYALAPVRTRPLRSYDPTQLSESSEGDLLLARLGRMARVDLNEWQRVKASLEQYGASTGLFDSIKIQKLGKGESDPFQIFVKAAGRETNIIDVGYGVSQVLPLFIILAELERHSTLLIQQPEVHLHPSAQAALGSVIAEAAANNRKISFVIETHSDFIVDRVRMAVRDGLIKHSDVSVMFFRRAKHNSLITNLTVSATGDFIDPPKSYRDFFLKENFKVMGF